MIYLTYICVALSSFFGIKAFVLLLRLSEKTIAGIFENYYNETKEEYKRVNFGDVGYQTSSISNHILLAIFFLLLARFFYF